MGLDAQIIGIGTFRAFDKADCLDYPRELYEDVADDCQIINTIATANTTEQSNDLARMCNVEPWDLGNHSITTVTNPHGLPICSDYIGEEEILKVYDILCRLLAHSVQLWYMPEG